MTDRGLITTGIIVAVGLLGSATIQAINQHAAEQKNASDHRPRFTSESIRKDLEELKRNSKIVIIRVRNITLSSDRKGMACKVDYNGPMTDKTATATLLFREDPYGRFKCDGVSTTQKPTIVLPVKGPSAFRPGFYCYPIQDSG